MLQEIGGKLRSAFRSVGGKHLFPGVTATGWRCRRWAGGARQMFGGHPREPATPWELFGRLRIPFVERDIAWGITRGNFLGRTRPPCRGMGC